MPKVKVGKEMVKFLAIFDHLLYRRPSQSNPVKPGPTKSNRLPPMNPFNSLDQCNRLHGERPSSGAATSARASTPKCSSAAPDSKLAAPEDGRSPAVLLRSDSFNLLVLSIAAFLVPTILHATDWPQ